MGPLYLQLNRNKRSLALDLKQPAARKALLQLCATADVLVHNIRPAAMRRLALSYEDVRKINLLCRRVGGWGTARAGGDAGKPAYDDLIQGFCAPRRGRAGGRMRAALRADDAVDRIVGINAAHAILAAVLRRDRTGEGQCVELPMFETMAQFVLGDHLGGRSFEPPTGDAGNPRLASGSRRPYATGDGYVCALVYTDKQWKAFFEGRGRLDLYAAYPHLMHFASRRHHYSEVQGIIADVLRTLTTVEALSLFERCDIPCAPMNDLDALIDDPHLAAVEFFQTRTHPTEGQIRYNGIPSRWNGAALKITRHAPRIGEHSVAVLKEAGVPAAEIGALLESGATVDGGPIAEADASALEPVARKSSMP